MRRFAVRPAAFLPLHIAGQRFMNMNHAQQMKSEAERQAHAPVTDYDFDKESWMKSMRFASMECVMDPDVAPINWRSFSGLKRIFNRWLTMKKIVERRPDFKVEDLRELYLQYKRLSGSNTTDVVRQLTRFTTFGEAQRLEKEASARNNAVFAAKSWKSLHMKSTTSSYEIEIETFDMINCFLAQMANEDWLQVTVKAVGKQRFQPTEDWTPFLEYPVFEVRLGDGIKVANNSPFIIVAVMDKTGSRYGRDGQDAAILRKNLARQSKGWLSKLMGS